MFYLFSKQTYGGTDYVQLKILDNIVVACNGWHEDIVECIDGNFETNVSAHNWSYLPDLLTLFTLLSSSYSPITADTHPELLI